MLNYEEDIIIFVSETLEPVKMSQSGDSTRKSADVEVASNNGQNAQTETQKLAENSDKKSKQGAGESQGNCYWYVRCYMLTY